MSDHRPQLLTLPPADLERARAGEPVQVVRADKQLNRKSCLVENGQAFWWPAWSPFAWGEEPSLDPGEQLVIKLSKLAPPYAEGEVVAVGEELAYRMKNRHAHSYGHAYVYRHDGEPVIVDGAYVWLEDASPRWKHAAKWADSMPLSAARLWQRCVKVEVVQRPAMKEPEAEDTSFEVQMQHVWLLTFERTEKP